ncbi:MAG: hypothetical protein ABI859_11705 [Pseudomonadota bacterium]
MNNNNKPALQWPPLRRPAWPIRWWNRRRRWLGRAGRVVLLFAIIGGGGYYWYSQADNPAARSSILTPSAIDDAMHGNPLWKRPSTAPNGKPWPAESGYLDGFPRLNVDGQAGVIADNSGGTNDLLVKLIDRDRTPTTAVRVGYVKAKQQFRMERVKPGRYDLRYLNLGNGRIRKSNFFEVALNATPKGKEYMGWRVGLFGVADGNAHHEDISARDF